MISRTRGSRRGLRIERKVLEPPGRQLHRLSALRVAKEVARGRYADGGGLLYMQIANSGACSWVFRFKLDGRMREVGLGPLSRVSLGEARKLAAGYREIVREQTDPILARREQRRRQLLDVSVDASVTFREAAEVFIRAREPEWRNRKHVQQWDNTLSRPLSNMAMLTLLRRMSRHVIESQTVAAYRRRGQLERRRLMMDDWVA